jgi:hypothetical protein
MMQRILPGILGLSDGWRLVVGGAGATGLMIIELHGVQRNGVIKDG